LATLESKRGEPAILALAERHRLPIRFFSAEMLAAVSGSERGSTLVEHHVRSRGVCEPAALLAAGAPELLVAKTIADSHALTLAIARIPFTSRAVTP
ncbi:MAG TPA: cobalamin biosynthesis protein, partial [Polyangiales bacterium]